MLITGPQIIGIIFVLISSILLFYYLYFFAKLAFYRSASGNDYQEPPPLTTIICGRNEEKNLLKNVPFVLQQAYDAPRELIVVNDSSEDDTKVMMQWMSQEHPTLRPVNIERKNNESAGKKYPLSIGIREARFSHLLLTDADCVPASAEWAQKMQSAYTPGIDIVLGYGAYQKLPGLLNKLIRFETFHSALQYLSYALAGQTYMGVGRNISYKKDLFYKHKGFASINHIPGGDDDLFINKAATATNTAIMIDEAAHTISTPEKKWHHWRLQKTRHYSTSKYYKGRHKFLLGLYSLSQFLFYPWAIATAIFFSWEIALIGLFVKSLTQYIIFSNAMKKLNENDLVKWIFFMDVWMVAYYVLFASTLWKKEKKTW